MPSLQRLSLVILSETPAVLVLFIDIHLLTVFIVTDYSSSVAFTTDNVSHPACPLVTPLVKRTSL